MDLRSRSGELLSQKIQRIVSYLPKNRLHDLINPVDKECKKRALNQSYLTDIRLDGIVLEPRREEFQYEAPHLLAEFRKQCSLRRPFFPTIGGLSSGFLLKHCCIASIADPSTVLG